MDTLKELMKFQMSFISITNENRHTQPQTPAQYSAFLSTVPVSCSLIAEYKHAGTI